MRLRLNAQQRHARAERPRRGGAQHWDGRLRAAWVVVALAGLACSESAPRGSPSPGSMVGGASAGFSGAASAGAAATSGGGMSAAGSAGSSGGDAVSLAGSGGAPGGAGDAGATSASGAAGTGGASGAAGAGGAAAVNWVGTWTAAAQLTEPSNLPPEPGLSRRTLRQVFYVSIGGSRLRLHFSNAYGLSPVTFDSVHLAVSTTGHSIDVASDRPLTFSGMASVTIPAGSTTTSDAFDFALLPQTSVALSIAFGEAPAEVTGHPGSRATSYIAPGNAAGAGSLTSPATTDHWYYATGIDVIADPPSAAVVTLGDSITDGRGSTTNGNDRWPDDLSRRLRQDAKTATVAVLNQGLGGNAVLSGGNGPPALTRFERDGFEPAGVRWLIVLLGVNDIGTSSSPAVAQDLIDAYQKLVTAARGRNLRVYGVPILPFGGSMYDSADHELARQTVNTWIRAAGHFDAVIDLEAPMRDPMTPTRLLAAYDSGDHLHPNSAGYHKMADTIALSLLTP